MLVTLPSAVIYAPAGANPRSRPNHLTRTVEPFLIDGWDLLIAFPPCTYLTAAGVSKWYRWQREQAESLAFVRMLMHAPIPKIAIENPQGLINTRIRKPDQTIHPWMFGHREYKRTCLWLKGLAPLTPTNVIPMVDRVEFIKSTMGHDREITFTGIARAMADQWG